MESPSYGRKVMGDLSYTLLLQSDDAIFNADMFAIASTTLTATPRLCVFPRSDFRHRPQHASATRDCRRFWIQPLELNYRFVKSGVRETSEDFQAYLELRTEHSVSTTYLQHRFNGIRITRRRWTRVFHQGMITMVLQAPSLLLVSSMGGLPHPWCSPWWNSRRPSWSRRSARASGQTLMSWEMPMSACRKAPWSAGTFIWR